MGLSRDLALALLSLSRSSLWSVTRTWKKTRKRLKKSRDEQEVGHLLPSLHFRRCKHTGWMRHPFHPWKTLKPQVYPAVSGLLSKNFVELFAQANIEIPKPAMPKLQLGRRTAAYIKQNIRGVRESVGLWARTQWSSSGLPRLYALIKICPHRAQRTGCCPRQRSAIAAFKLVRARFRSRLRAFL